MSGFKPGRPSVVTAAAAWPCRITGVRRVANVPSDPRSPEKVSVVAPGKGRSEVTRICSPVL
jgi:hypothetical protein